MEQKVERKFTAKETKLLAEQMSTIASIHKQNQKLAELKTKLASLNTKVLAAMGPGVVADW